MKRFFYSPVNLGTCVMLGTLALASNISFAQGWVAPSANVLAPYNLSLGLTPMSIGIGTIAPTEQLHTTDGVRFTGLTLNNAPSKVVVQDSNGKLFAADPSIFGGGGASWNLNGNTGTIPGTSTGQNYLGTSDAQRLVIATSGTEKMTILPSGLVGVNSTNPTNRLQVIGNSNERDVHIAVGGNAPSLKWFKGSVQPDFSLVTPFAKIGLATTSADFIATSIPGDMVIQNVTKSSSIIFSSFFANNIGNGIEQMRLDAKGQLGINTASPTARLHVLCNPQTANKSDVRFQNLPIGRGNALVMDADGYVYRSERLVGKSTNNNDDDLLAIIATLQKQVDYLLVQNNIFQKGGASEIMSDILVFPNPATDKTTIELRNSLHLSSARVQIFNMEGKMVLDNSTEFGDDQKSEINTSSFAPGTYLVKVFGDQKLIGAKSIIIIK